MYDLPVFTYGDGAPEDEAVREPLRAWVRSLGLDPSELDDRAVVVPALDGSGYELHVERLLSNERGHNFLDPLYGWDQDRLRSERVIVRVAKGSWPRGSAVEKLNVRKVAA